MTPRKGPLPPAEDIGKLVPIERIADQTPYSAAFLRQLARSGKLLAYKFNRDWMTTPKAVLLYLQNQRSRYERKIESLHDAERSLL